MLIALAVVLLLVALAVPAFSKIRGSARSTASSVNLRSIGQQVHMYLSAYQDTMPFPDAQASFDPSLRGDSALSRTNSHFDFTVYWYTLMRQSAGEQGWEAWLSPGTAAATIPLDAGPMVGYAYSATMLAQPDVWSMSPPAQGTKLLAVRHNRLRNPTGKVIFWDKNLSFIRQKVLLGPTLWDAPTPMLLADGHVRVYHPRDASSPVVNTLDDNPDRAGLPLHNTSRGCEGTDY